MVKGVVPKPIEDIPGPSRLVPDKTPPISPTESELDIERGLDFGPGEKDDDYGLEPPQEEEEEDPYGINLTKLCQEGGVELLSYLMAKGVSPTAEAPTHPKSWGYKDISRLPELEKKEWQNTCLQELEALRRCDVYELVQRPRGCKVIKNRWVFDVKTDGRKKARLVTKGFSQVEGLDYDQVFSPVVWVETVHLILAMAALRNWTISGLCQANMTFYCIDTKSQAGMTK